MEIIVGGNCLKNCVTRRYQKQEYFDLVPSVLDRVIRNWSVTRVSLIEAYRNKESFGDMDVLYSTDDNKPFTVETVKSLFPESKEIVRNTNVISFEYKELQIDLIHVPAESFNYALAYFKFSDLGNLIGRIAHRFGLKHGHLGLFLPIRDESNNDNVIGEVLITRNYSDALMFFDLDPNRFHRAFDTLEEIYEFVLTSKWFHPDSYDLAELSHMHRTRDKKRTTYQGFLEYIKGYSGNFIPRRTDKTFYMEMIFDAFPYAYNQYSDMMKEMTFKKVVKEKFNGDMVSSLTGLQSKELGEFMKHLKTLFWFKPENVVYSTQRQIEERIVCHYKKWMEVNAL